MCAYTACTLLLVAYKSDTLNECSLGTGTSDGVLLCELVPVLQSHTSCVSQEKYAEQLPPLAKNLDD